ncbi:MAG: hypothetical protein MR301_00235 [Prevotella sp.]|nr:hypothetical protein [Prevotella sp.]MDY5546871.1 hypothetical protein [Prevotella sp.]
MAPFSARLAMQGIGHERMHARFGRPCFCPTWLQGANLVAQGVTPSCPDYAFCPPDKQTCMGVPAPFARQAMEPCP